MSTCIRQHGPPYDDRPCVCAICTCGKHECPGIPKMTPLGGQSSYRDHYPAKTGESERAAPIRQPQQVMSNRAAPGHFVTSNQAAFDPITNSPRDRSVSFKPKQGATQSTPFAGNSSYHSDYPGHQPDTVSRAKAPREALQKAPAAPGAFETTNQAANNAITQALRDGTLDRNAPRKHTDGALVKTPFDGKSSYQDQYVGHTPQVSSPRRANPTAMKSASDSRDFLTTNGAAYQKPPENHGPMCPASFCQRRPPSRDGHIKLEEVPDSRGNLSPAREWSEARKRHLRA